MGYVRTCPKSCQAGFVFSLNQTTRASERLHDVRADGLLLGELQLPQRTVADVVVRDVSARVVEESADAVLGYTGHAAERGAASAQVVDRGAISLTRARR